MAEYLYRGLHAGHPALVEARMGMVRAAMPESTVTPKEHNLGSRSGRSPFTSWSRERMVAVEFAESAGCHGGLLLRVEDLPPGPDATWEWVESPDERSESEVLMRGFRMDAEVVEL
jgi:hypothetical protein